MPAVLACILLGGCGGNTPSAPTTPTSTPAVPSPEPTSGGFLHVSHGSTLITYAIDAATGQLRESATQRLGDTAQLTGEPQGRFVFAAYNPVYPRSGSIVAYSPDPSTGNLTTLDEATGLSACYWLSASSTRVYAMSYDFLGDHYVAGLSSHAVASDGQLGPVSLREFEWDHVPSAALDPDADPDVLYNSTSNPGGGRGGVAANFVAPDGSLRQMGASYLCVASTMEYSSPLVAARGLLFSSADVAATRPYATSRESVCSWQGPRLAPRANLGLAAYRAVAFVPRRGASPLSATALVAMAVGEGSAFWGERQEQHEIRLFAARADGDVAPLDAATGPWGVRDLLFHPSGRFLYASYVAYYEESPIGLDVYSIDPEGHLELVQTLEDGGGRMAVTTPPQARASTGPAMP